MPASLARRLSTETLACWHWPSPLHISEGDAQSLWRMHSTASDMHTPCRQWKPLAQAWPGSAQLGMSRSPQASPQPSASRRCMGPTSMYLSAEPG